MTDYSSYPTLLQSSQTEYVSSETMDVANNQLNNNNNNNIIYNSAPLILLNSQKPDMTLLQNSMMNDGQTYVTIQTQSATGSSDLNGAKLLNTPIIIQSSSNLPIQSSQYQQQQHQQQQQQTSSSINVQQNASQMTSLTQSQLQSLSYLMQTQIAPQFIQTSNGLIQIIPQGFFTTQQQQQPNQGQGHDHTLQTQITGLPTLGWSLGNFNGSNNPITLDNQLQPLQLNNLSLPQLIPVQHVIQSNNSFFSNQTDDQDQMVSTIVDLNVTDKKTPNRKPSRRKRKPTTKVTGGYSSQLSSPLAHPTSTNEVKQEPAESSSGKISSSIVNESVTQYDNKGRPFSFVCPDCPKKFTLNSRLSAHMRCHTGMRPFTCTVCGFSFTQKSYLIRHAAVHKEERPFHCEKCQKSYKHYGSLANHRKLHRKDDGKSEMEMCGDLVKMEPTASDNGRSSSISSLVINACADFPSMVHKGYQDVSGILMCHEEQQSQQQQQHDKVIEANNNNSSYTISSTTTSVNGIVTDMDNNDSYIKQLGLMYPISLSTDNSNQVGKSSNVFFQEQLDDNHEINGNYVMEEGLEEEEEEEECDDEEEEDDEEVDDDEIEERDCSRDTQMVDLSMNHIQSNCATISSEYHL